MSSRILIKKYIFPAGPVKHAAKKRWSSVKTYIGPIHHELVNHGDGFKSVLYERNRFAEVEPRSCQDLHPQLSNTDVRLAVPDMQDQESFRWAHTFTLKWKRLVEDVNKFPDVAVRALPLGFVVGGGGVGSDGDDDDTITFYVRASSLRSRVLMVEMTMLSDSCHSCPPFFCHVLFWWSVCENSHTV